MMELGEREQSEPATSHKLVTRKSEISVQCGVVGSKQGFHIPLDAHTEVWVLTTRRSLSQYHLAKILLVWLYVSDVGFEYVVSWPPYASCRSAPRPR
jgi:hypothetical protein